MTGNRIGRLALALGAAALVAGCQTGGPFAGLARAPAGDETAEVGTAPGLVEREVEAPEVFATTEPGLWDGRPSLGGVWIAHPDTKNPERVMIRNTENGKSIVGALFRREREMPGPRLQVSSDAAAALELLAGKPTELRVVALRREEVPDAPPPKPKTEARSEPKPAPEAAPLAAAAAAIEAAEARKVPGATPPPPRHRAAPAPSAAPAPAPVRAPRMAPGDVAAPPPGTVDIPGETAASRTAAAPAPAAPTAPRAAALDKPFIQIGIFNVEDYAEDVAEKLRKGGVVPTVLGQQRDGKPFWRVVVGPATTRSDRSALLEKVKGLGYTDAYYVTN